MYPSVSVIVPVYNVEDYLKECLDSIVNQTERNIEIIIVNDASPDNSESIILKYAEKHKNFRYIKHEKNLGVNAARNTGCHNAKGEYVLFVDSDDYLKPQMVEKMLLKAKKNNLDCVICDYMLLKNNKLEPSNRFNLKNSNAILDQCDALRQFLFINAAGVLWNKLLKRKIYIQSSKTIKIDRMETSEDALNLIHFFINAKRFGAITEKLYVYRKHSKSVTSNTKAKHVQSMLYFLRELNELKKNEIVICFSKEYNAYRFGKIISTYSKYLQLKPYEQDTNIHSEIVKMLNGYSIWFMLKNPYIDMKKLFKFILYKINLFKFAVNTKQLLN